MGHKLKNSGLIHLTDNVLRSLTQNRIVTTQDFLQEDVNKLLTITKLSLPQILAVRSDIFNKYSAPVTNGVCLLERLTLSQKNLSTGIEKLDQILKGGLSIGFITEVCGLADSGKTQLCLQLAINCVKNSGNTVLYIDTKGDFSAIRVQKILDAAGYSHKEMAAILLKIKVVRIWTIEELIELFQNIKKETVVFQRLILIIIDSLPCLMLQFLGDDSKLGLRLLNIFVNYSRYLCKEFQISLVCVNIQTRWIDQDVADLDDDGESIYTAKDTYMEKRNRCLGKYWQHIPFLVLLLEKQQQTNENNTVLDCSIMISNSMETNYQKISLNVGSLGVT